MYKERLGSDGRNMVLNGTETFHGSFVNGVWDVISWLGGDGE